MATQISASIAGAAGLAREDAALVSELVKVWSAKHPRNVLRSAYYDLHHAPRDLGIAIPPSLRDLEQVCGWPAKAVRALSDRSRFDGFVCTDSDVDDQLAAICSRNRVKRTYRMSCRNELKHGCSFLTVTAGDDGAPVVSAYSAESSAALWDGARKRIKAGMVVVERDTRPGHREPTWVNVFTDDAVIRVRRRWAGGPWTAEYFEHGMGRCLMEPLVHDAELDRPFGHSRISRAVMDITDDAIRSARRMEVSAEFFTSPQKYLLGAGEDAFENKSKWEAYIGTIFAISKDRDGDVPTFGQLSQGSMQPHVDYIRQLAAKFSGETNVPLSSLGVVSDNPSSAEAIYAAKEDLVIDAQNLNDDNGDALRNVAIMCLAVADGTTFDEQEARGINVQAKWRNPAAPSVVSQADAMSKMLAVMPDLASSDVVLEEYGFSDDQIARIHADIKRAGASKALSALLTGGEDGSD